ncbi:MAG: YlxR family protein [Chloroflexota bacterium]
MKATPKTAHEPRRTCVGCRQEGAKGELVRLVRAPGGQVVIDLAGRAPGRGAYLHRRRDCLEAAHRRGGLNRALKTAVPESVWAQLEG